MYKNVAKHLIKYQKQSWYICRPAVVLVWNPGGLLLTKSLLVQTSAPPLCQMLSVYPTMHYLLFIWVWVTGAADWAEVNIHGFRVLCGDTSNLSSILWVSPGTPPGMTCPKQLMYEAFRRQHVQMNHLNWFLWVWMSGDVPWSPWRNSSTFPWGWGWSQASSGGSSSALLINSLCWSLHTAYGHRMALLELLPSGQQHRCSAASAHQDGPTPTLFFSRGEIEDLDFAHSD